MNLVKFSLKDFFKDYYFSEPGKYLTMLHLSWTEIGVLHGKPAMLPFMVTNRCETLELPILYELIGFLETGRSSFVVRDALYP